MGNQASTNSKKGIVLEKSIPHGIKKHFCIIGGGSSGLIIMKELLAYGHDVTCFERLPVIGGVYVKSYKDTVLTTSSLLTAWSDYSDGKEACPKFWTAEEYLVYLDGFATKFDLKKKIKFSHNVETVRKCIKTDKWLVTARGGYPCSGFLRCPDIPCDPNAEPFTLAFDGVCVCAGTNNYASLPKFVGQEKFKGVIVFLICVVLH